MVNSVSRRISAGLCKAGLIPSEDFELYAYGFFVILSRLLFFVITIIFGVLFGVVLEGILFYTFFSLIRSYAGGIHAPREWMCIILTSSFLFFCIWGIKVLSLTALGTYIFFLFTIAIVIILIFSPLDTKEKPLKPNEKRLYRTKTYLLLLAIIFFSILMIVFNKRNFFYAGMMSLVLESILLLLGKIMPTVKKFISTK